MDDVARKENATSTNKKAISYLVLVSILLCNSFECMFVPSFFTGMVFVFRAKAQPSSRTRSKNESTY